MTRHRVLVIEPDELLRALVAEWLEQAGFHPVFPPAGSQEASAGLGPIEAIVIDIPAPALAEGVLRAWRRAYPHAHIVVASGRCTARGTANDAMARTLDVAKVLAKPFCRRDLMVALGVQGA